MMGNKTKHAYQSNRQPSGLVGVVYVTMNGFIPAEVFRVFGDKSNDWLVVRVVATPTGRFGWPGLAKPKPK